MTAHISPLVHWGPCAGGLRPPRRPGTAKNACGTAISADRYFTKPRSTADNQFVTTVVAQTGNVTLLYPAKKTMREFTQRLYRIRVGPWAESTPQRNQRINERAFLSTSCDTVKRASLIG